MTLPLDETREEAHTRFMTLTSHPNLRFEALRQIAGLELEGAYEVRSVSLLSGHYNVIGRTDDVRDACAAKDLLNACHRVNGCEEFQAHESMGVLA